MYAKIENGELKPAPKEFVEDNKNITGFTDVFLRQRGYKPVVFVQPESEDMIPVYTETETEIIQSWVMPE